MARYSRRCVRFDQLGNRTACYPFLWRCHRYADRYRNCDLNACRFRLIYSNSDDNLGGGDVLDIHSPQAPPPGPYYPLPNPSASVNGPPWFQQNLQHSLTNFDHEPLYPANSYRVPHASFVNSSNYAWTPRSRDKGVIEEPTGHHQHPPSPCTVTHPPTPPPSSVDTANLEAAIGVSFIL